MRKTVKGYYSIRILAAVYHISPRDIWSSEKFRGFPQIAQILTRKQFQFLAIHIRYNKMDLPKRGEPGYHPFQNSMGSTEILCRNSNALWIPGEAQALDETCTVCNSEYQRYKKRSKEKPIKSAIQEVRRCDCGQVTRGFTLQTLPMAH